MEQIATWDHTDEEWRGCLEMGAPDTCPNGKGGIDTGEDTE